MNVTLKDIVNGLNDFVNNHPQINEFGFGNVSNITTKDHTYSMLWLMLTNINYKGEDGNTTVFQFEIHMMDIWNGTQEHALQLVNDLTILGNDVVSYFFRDNQNLWFELNEETVTAAPYEGKFDDLVIDVVFNVEIEIPTNLNECIIPIN